MVTSNSLCQQHLHVSTHRCVDYGGQYIQQVTSVGPQIRRAFGKAGDGELCVQSTTDCHSRALSGKRHSPAPQSIRSGNPPTEPT